MNEVTREVDELLHGDVVFTNELIAVPVTREGVQPYHQRQARQP